MREALGQPRYSHAVTENQLSLPIEVPSLPDGVNDGRASLAHGRFHPRSLAPPEATDGGGFDYGVSPGLFLGRVGVGPLRMAWDSNILIDWVEHGAALLRDGEPHDAGHEKVQEELTALGAVMALWFTRDIRVRPLPGQLKDFSRPAPERERQRAEHVLQMASALSCVGLEGEARPVRRSARWQAPWIRPARDRRLVEEAIVAGCHVFLTRDEGDILPHHSVLRTRGLVALTPLDLLTELLVSGELGRPFGADGLVCDSHKAVHLWAIVKGNGPE